MKRLTTHKVVFSSEEIKKITGFELKNSWGIFSIEHEEYGIIPEKLNKEDEPWSNDEFVRCIKKIEKSLRNYAYRNFVGDFYKIVNKGEFYPDSIGITEMFHSDNETQVFFYYEDEDYLEI